MKKAIIGSIIFTIVAVGAAAVLFKTLNIENIDSQGAQVFSLFKKKSDTSKTGEVIKQESEDPLVYPHEYKKLEPVNGNEIPIDIEIVPFKETKTYSELNKKNIPIDFELVDGWGYPLNKEFIKKYSNATERNTLMKCGATQDSQSYFLLDFDDVRDQRGAGYDDPALHPNGLMSIGENRQQELCDIFSWAADILQIDFGPEHVEIVIDVRSSFSNTGALAYVSNIPYWWDQIDSGCVHNNLLREKGPAFSGGHCESVHGILTTTFHMQYPWDIDTSNGLDLNEFSFATVHRHEIFHLLGFFSRLYHTTDGDSQRFFSDLDLHLYGNELIQTPMVDSSLPLNQDPFADFAYDQVVYRGNYSSENSQPIYSTLGGSGTLSHFDMARAEGEEYLMHHSLGSGIERDPHTDELGVLCDLGYSVESIQTCNPTLIPKDDNIILNAEVISIHPLENDYFSGDSENVRIHSVDFESRENGDRIQYFFVRSDGTLAELLNANRAEVIKLTLSDNKKVRSLSYDIFNIDTGHISRDAVIRLVPCNAEEGEYLCNGDFELEPEKLLNKPFFSTFNFPNSWFECRTDFDQEYDFVFGNVPFWCEFENTTPDMFGQNLPYFSNHNNMNLPWVAPNGIEYSFPENSSGEPNHYGAWMFIGGYDYQESLVTRLKEPLQEGSEYKLTFDVVGGSFVLASTGSGQLEPETIKVKANLFINQEPFSPATTSVDDQQELLEDIWVTEEWQHIEKTFVANNKHGYLNIGISAEDNQNASIYIDNISLIDWSTPVLCTSDFCVGALECKDGRDNDRDRLIDEADPGCWKDPNDPATYNPNDPSEFMLEEGDRNTATTLQRNINFLFNLLESHGRTIQKGDNYSYVAILKKLINAYNITEKLLIMTGEFDETTEKAVKGLQAMLELEADGIVTQDFLRKLHENTIFKYDEQESIESVEIYNIKKSDGQSTLQKTPL